MSNVRYLEIDSTYRDRNTWPLAAQFEIPISQSGRKSRLNAADPVSLAVPVMEWTPNRVDMSTNTNVVSGTIAAISSPNNVAGTTDTINLIITATTGKLQKLLNYYYGLVFNDTTLSPVVKRRITAYEYLGVTSTGADKALITLEKHLPDTFQLGDNWSIYDPSDISDPSNPLFFVPAGQVQENAYSNYYLYNETLEEYRKITYYNWDTHLITLDAINNPITGWTLAQNYSIRLELPIVTTAIGAVTSSSVFTLNVTTTENDFYKGQFVRILPVLNPYKYNVFSQDSTVLSDSLTPPIGQIRRILSSTAGATTSVIVYPAFEVAPSGGAVVELLNFSYDNLCPFVYTGSTVSQQEMVCYEIELVNLILPNDVLQGGAGGRIAYYPYVYVELQNVSASGAGLKNIIYSNNPNSGKMLFRCPVNDINSDMLAPFVKISGDGMVQTIKFKPNDNLRFSVTYQNGEIFQTVGSETYSPFPPNLKYQVSALFSMKRI